jgi:cyclopropane-fatty-acyl-phospholipid synthase
VGVVGCARIAAGEAQRVLETTGSGRDAAKVLRAYRLYLAGCAMCFERGWIGLHQVLATRPDAKLESGNIRGAQSTYPFNREYMYSESR